MTRPAHVLLQTTIVSDTDDWHIGRFSLLRNYLANIGDAAGKPKFIVEARDRSVRCGPDPVLSQSDSSHFDALWLFAVDVGDGLDPADCDAIA